MRKASSSLRWRLIRPAAVEALAGRPRERALVFATELCSLTFLRGDTSKSNLVATALFADGAAGQPVGSGQQGQQQGGEAARQEDRHAARGRGRLRCDWLTAL